MWARVVGSITTFLQTDEIWDGRRTVSYMCFTPRAQPELSALVLPFLYSSQELESDGAVPVLILQTKHCKVRISVSHPGCLSPKVAGPDGPG